MAMNYQNQYQAQGFQQTQQPQGGNQMNQGYAPPPNQQAGQQGQQNTEYMFNNFSVIGRLTKDPEVRQLQNGSSVVEVDIANNVGDHTNFIKIQAYSGNGDKPNRTFNYINQYCQKGKKVLVQGRLKVEKYESKNLDQQGQPIKATSVSIQVSDIHGLSNPQEGGGNGGGGGQQQQQRPQQQQYQQAPPQQNNFNQGPPAQGGGFQQQPPQPQQGGFNAPPQGPPNNNFGGAGAPMPRQ